MDRKSFDRWTKRRSMGRTRFIWLVGVLGWGLTMTVVMGIYEFFDHPNHPALWGLTVFGAVVFLIGGYFFGMSMWYFLEKDYQRSKVLFEIVSNVYSGSSLLDSRPQADNGRVKNRKTEDFSETLAPHNPNPKDHDCLTRETLASVVVDALIDAGLLKQEQFRNAFDIVRKKIEALGDYSPFG